MGLERTIIVSHNFFGFEMGLSHPVNDRGLLRVIIVSSVQIGVQMQKL